VIEGLAIFVPAGTEATTCHRVRYLNPKAASFLVFVHDAHETDGWEQRVNPGDYTNLQTRLDPCRRPLTDASPQVIRWAERIATRPGVERRDRPDGSASFAVNGLEFARIGNQEILFGLDRKRTARRDADLSEIEKLAGGLVRMRCADAVDRRNPLYTRHPEAWLESRVRSDLEAIEATLQAVPVYGQVPEMAGGTRGILDLVAVDGEGRLAILELKVTQDIHLPLQALDYWMRVKWHLDRGEFSERGYFPGIQLRKEAPRLILVAPALEWHPSNEVILKYVDPPIDIERVGIGLEWRRGIKVMFRSGANLT
jgi:hypothetical protein